MSKSTNPAAFVLKQRIKEFPKYHPVALRLLARLLYLNAKTKQDVAPRLTILNRAYGWAESGNPLEKRILGAIRQYLPSVDKADTKQLPWLSKQVGWGRYQQWLDRAKAVSRTMMLKAPGSNGEKGVIISYFEYNWLRLLGCIDDFETFDKQYDVIFAASWSPGNYDMLALALERVSGPVIVQAANYEEFNKLRNFHPRIHVLNTIPTDWLDPDVYEPIPWEKREIDLLVVANWAVFKRHWHLFRVLAKLPEDLKVVCIGQPDSGRTIETIRAIQHKMGARQQIDYRQSLPIEEVIKAQANSKLATIFSLREGGCVAATEAIMAGTPLVLLKDAHIGSKAYINEQTGALLEPDKEHIQIADLLKNGGKLRPREWALENISCEVTHRKVNDELKQLAAASGQPWTNDLRKPCFKPYPTFLDPSDFDALHEPSSDLTTRYPEVFPEGWMLKARK